MNRCSRRLHLSQVPSWTMAAVAFMTSIFISSNQLFADGFMRGPKFYQGRPYSGSVEEKSQEAIIIFNDSKTQGMAKEILILKVQVHGEVDNFAWIIPFPNVPKVEKDDPKLFEELHRYVEKRLVELSKNKKGKGGFGGAGGGFGAGGGATIGVEIISKKVVGAFDIAIVRENEKGALNKWLEKEKYQTLDDAEDVLKFYRDKKYVFVCIKVNKTQLGRSKEADLHPLRFTFKTGGRDGIFFPMKLTGLQKEPFHVNLYVFYKWWLNDRISKYGYEHRGFIRKYRDWDTIHCKPNAGKAYYAPQADYFLKKYTRSLPRVSKMMTGIHPLRKYYLTNIQARNLKPEDVRKWKDDLWLFPYYLNKRFVPYDARSGGVASTMWKE